MTPSFRTDRSEQTVQTQIRLLLEEQSDHGLHCLLFHLHHLTKYLKVWPHCLNFRYITAKFSGIQKFKNFTVHLCHEEDCFWHMSRDVRKPRFCICENKDADQLRGNREADQRLCFRYIASTIPLLPKYKISSL